MDARPWIWLPAYGVHASRVYKPAVHTVGGSRALLPLGRDIEGASATKEHGDAASACDSTADSTAPKSHVGDDIGSARRHSRKTRGPNVLDRGARSRTLDLRYLPAEARIRLQHPPLRRGELEVPAANPATLAIGPDRFLGSRTLSFGEVSFSLRTPRNGNDDVHTSSRRTS